MGCTNCKRSPPPVPLQEPRRIVLLGIGSCGKTTFLKQMLLHHGEGIPNRLKLVRPIRVGVIGDLLKLALNTEELTDMKLSDEANENLALLEAFLLDDTIVMDEDLVEAIESIWRDSAVQSAWSHYQRIHIAHSTRYFLNKRLEALASPDYLPSDEDLIRSRVKTERIHEVNFIVESQPFKMIDCGGQRDQREKWDRYFQDYDESWIVDGVAYISALSDFNTPLEEDPETLTIFESLEVFEDVAQRDVFKNTSLILFLNKIDLFEQMVARGTTIRHVFPEYDGPDDEWESMASYLQREFDKRLPQDRILYHHLTCATDTANCLRVFSAVEDRLVQEQMQAGGFL